MGDSSDSSSDEEFLLLDGPLNLWYRSQTAVKETVHPINKKRAEFGEYHHLMPDLKRDSARFFSYMRMTQSTFVYILDKIQKIFRKEWKNCHSLPISAEERLMVTLR